MKELPSFVPPHCIASVSGVPIKWLIREGDAGRIPMLRAGRRRLFDLEKVLSVLHDRAAISSKGGAS